MRHNFVFGGLYPRLNPAFLRIGAIVEVQPLSVLNLRAHADLSQFFAAFALLQSYPTAGADWSDTALGAGERAGRHYATTGFHLVLEPRLQVKVGPLAVVNKLQLKYSRIGVRPGDALW